MFDLGGDIQTAGAAQAQIHYHHVGFCLDAGLRNIFVAAGFFNDVQISLLRQQGGQSLSKQDVVINQGKANFVHCCAPNGRDKSTWFDYRHLP
jgi:hypothetical protein